MRLTGPRNESSDDLRSALADRFGDAENPTSPGDSSEDRVEDSSDESPSPFFASTFTTPTPVAFAREGDTLLPGGDALVEELRQQVEALVSLELGPIPWPPDPAPAALDLPPMAESPAAMRFGPTAAAPPPTLVDLPMPAPDSPDALDPFAELDTFDSEPDSVPDPTPLPEPEVEVVRRRVTTTAPPTGDAIKIKKSSSDKGGRKRFGKKTKSDAPVPPSHDVDGSPSAGMASPGTPSPGMPAPGAGSLTADDVEGPRHTGTPLGELLIGRGLVSEEQLREALTTQTGSGKRLGNILVELGLLSERGLVEVLAEQLQVEIVELGNMELDRDLVTLLSEEDARLLKAVPIARDGTRLVVAVADPLGEHLQDHLIEKLGVPVTLRFATATDIDAVINKMYASTADLGDALRMFEARLESRKSTKEVEQTVTTVVDENAPVVKVVNLILDHAVRARASDVHIEPMAQIVRVRVRVDGALHEVMTLPAQMGASLLSRIKVMSDMNIVERRKPQDGQLAATIAGRDLDVRVSTTPTVFGEKCVMRVLDKSKAVIDLPGLGMSPETNDRYTDLIKSPYGMVICAGPTGSGKTTTLYATLTAISNENINVVTIEDPVEYVFPTINQIQINEAAGLTFANGLRAILRQDPDAILVGEIRDVETARIAVQAALTGHFVLSSLHATDATSALHRFMDMGIEPFLVASSLLGVVGQRLVRKICPNCIAPYEPTPDERAFYERGGGEPDKTGFVQGAGCTFCGQTGYYDRVGIYEVMAVTDELKELIVTSASHAELRELAMAQGMRTLRDQAIHLVTQNKTTIAEVLRTVYVL
jgi:type IV pilus assembly protein PilB